MKVIDLHKGKKKLTKLGQSLKFSDFVDLLGDCLKSDQAFLDELITFWQEKKHELSSQGYLLEFLPIICRIRILYPTPRHPQIDLQPTALESAMKFVEAMDEIDRQREPFRATYSWFSPTLCVAPLLEASYPEELDPGRIIANHLTTLFPNNLPEELSGLIRVYFPANACSLLFATPAWDFLNELACWVGEHIVDKPQRICFRECLLDLLDPENRARRSSTISISEKLVLVHHAPNKLFHEWIWGYFLHSDEDGSFASKLSTDELKVALLSLAFGGGEPPLGLNPVFKQVRGVAALKKLPAFEERKLQGNHLPWQAFYSLLYRVKEDEVALDAECYQLLQAATNSFTRFRHMILGGISPVDQDMLRDYNDITINSIGTDHSDLLQLLADGEWDFSFLNLMPEKIESSYLEQIHFFNEKQTLYLQLFVKAHAEGLYELGTALLSLYLFYRAIFLKGRLNLSPDMLEAINNALQLPGAKTLKHTLSIEVESVDEYFSADPIACCSAMILRQFIPQSTQLKVLPGKAGQEGTLSSGAEETKVFFIRELGADRWAKLSENSRSCLVSAELQWKNSALEFGFGIKDWSGLITTYCKAIEGELVDRLGDFFASGEYESYLAAKGLKRPAKPTAGWLLKELKSYESMPEKLKTVLAKSKIRLAGDSDLLNRLYDISQNYRNISAHHDVVPMKRFAEFKDKMFQSGLLHRFIDAFV